MALADQVVVMSDAASQRLCDGFDIDRHKVVTIPHGATLPTKLPLKRSGRPTLLTWGLLGPGKGVERVAGSVLFDPAYRDRSSLTALVQSLGGGGAAL